MPTDDGDPGEILQTAGNGTLSWEADATGGSTVYNSIGDATAAGSISFDDTETATYTTVQDTAGSFFNLINSNADVSNQVYMLDVDYSADDGDVDADFIKKAQYFNPTN